MPSQIFSPDTGKKGQKPLRIKTKKLRPDAKLPKRGSDKAAGYDLYACTDHHGVFAIPPHTTLKIGTGISMAIPDGYFGAIFARSGIATKQGLRPANCVGVVDSDYRGEIIVALHNDTGKRQTFANGDRVAQLVIMQHFPVDFDEVDDLDETERGDGGFGSTGKNDKPDEMPGQMSLFNE